MFGFGKKQNKQEQKKPEERPQRSESKARAGLDAKSYTKLYLNGIVSSTTSEGVLANAKSLQSLMQDYPDITLSGEEIDQVSQYLNQMGNQHPQNPAEFYKLAEFYRSMKKEEPQPKPVAKAKKPEIPEELTRENDRAVTTFTDSIYQAIKREDYEHAMGLAEKLANYIQTPKGVNQINLQTKAILGNRIELLGQEFVRQHKNNTAQKAYEIASMLGDKYAAECLEALKSPKKETERKEETINIPSHGLGIGEIVVEGTSKKQPSHVPEKPVERKTQPETLEAKVETSAKGDVSLKKQAGKCLDILANLQGGYVDMQQVHQAILTLKNIFRQNPQVIEGNELVHAIYLTKEAGKFFLDKSKSSEEAKEKIYYMMKARKAYQIAALIDGDEEKANYEKFLTNSKYLETLQQFRKKHEKPVTYETLDVEPKKEAPKRKRPTNPIDSALFDIAENLEQKTEESISKALKMGRSLEKTMLAQAEKDGSGVLFAFDIENAMKAGNALTELGSRLYREGNKKGASEAARIAYEVIGFPHAQDLYAKLGKEIATEEKPAEKLEEKVVVPEIEKPVEVVVKPKERKGLHPLIKTEDWTRFLERTRSEIRGEKPSFPKDVFESVAAIPIQEPTPAPVTTYETPAKPAQEKPKDMSDELKAFQEFRANKGARQGEGSLIMQDLGHSTEELRDKAKGIFEWYDKKRAKVANGDTIITKMAMEAIKADTRPEGVKAVDRMRLYNRSYVDERLSDSSTEMRTLLEIAMVWNRDADVLARIKEHPSVMSAANRENIQHGIEAKIQKLLEQREKEREMEEQ